MANSDKKAEQESWTYNVKYCGGHMKHVVFGEEVSGILNLSGEPENHISFKSPQVNMEIPLSKVKGTRIVATGGIQMMGGQKILFIDFEDVSGYMQSPAFRFFINQRSQMNIVEEAANNIYTLREHAVNIDSMLPAHLTNSNKTLAICPKCKSKISADSKFCPECGADLRIKSTKT